MHKKEYSLNQIRSAWTTYRTRKVLRVLKDGKWITMPIPKGGLGRVPGSQAKMVALHTVKDFPDYLTEYFKEG